MSLQVLWGGDFQSGVDSCSLAVELGALNGSVGSPTPGSLGDSGSRGAGEEPGQETEGSRARSTRTWDPGVG